MFSTQLDGISSNDSSTLTEIINAATISIISRVILSLGRSRLTSIFSGKKGEEVTETKVSSVSRGPGGK